MNLRTTVQRILTQLQRQTIPASAGTPAGVLLLMYENEGDHHVLFTKRTSRVEHHKGEISFPGGSRDEEDPSLEHTALRETEEEIGVATQDVEVIGKLDDIVTRSNHVVTPFVGFMPYPYEFRLSEFEVEELLQVPLRHLLDPANFVPDPRLPFGNAMLPSSYRWGEHVIFGATARMVTQFLNLLREAEGTLGTE